VTTQKRADGVATTCIELLQTHASDPNIRYAQDRDSGATAFVVQRGDTQFICFPGSDSKIDFLKINANTEQVRPALLVSTCNGGKSIPQNARIHSGFQFSYSTIRDEIRSMILPSKRTIVCGHSLGGALAILCSLELCVDNLQVVTFGSPRVGNDSFNEFLTRLPFGFTHYVTHLDPIAALPTIFPKNSGLYIKLPTTNPTTAHFLSSYQKGFGGAGGEKNE